MSVEFIYDRDCPNVAAARTNLMRAFAQAGTPAKWKEWERSSPDTPEYARQFGSPAVLVNGTDIAGHSPNSGSACRIYSTGDGKQSGMPPAELIAQALSADGREGGAMAVPGGAKRQWLLLPAIGFALLPKLACPACWPAYAGLLSALGLGFLVRTEFLLPLTAIFLAVVLMGLAFRARARRGYGPLLVGIAGAVAVLAGKFALESSFLFYSGLGLLVGASLWNTWPRRKSKTASCCECAPAGRRLSQ